MRDPNMCFIDRTYLTPGQKQARYIRMLENWVIVLGGTSLAMLMKTLIPQLCWGE